MKGRVLVIALLAVTACCFTARPAQAAHATISVWTGESPDPDRPWPAIRETINLWLQYLTSNVVNTEFHCTLLGVGPPSAHTWGSDELTYVYDGNDPSQAPESHGFHAEDPGFFSATQPGTYDCWGRVNIEDANLNFYWVTTPDEYVTAG